MAGNCPKCGGEMEQGRIAGSFAFGFKSHRQKPWSTAAEAGEARACLHCGYLETYVDPRQVKAKLGPEDGTIRFRVPMSECRRLVRACWIGGSLGPVGIVVGIASQNVRGPAARWVELTILGIVILAFAIIGYGFWRFWRVAARAERGRCVACGYDLRATPGRCPECGAVSEPVA